MASSSDDNSLTLVSNMNFNTFSELFAQIERMNSSTVQRIITSVSHDSQRQNFIVLIANLLQRETEIVFEQQESDNRSMEVYGISERLKKLSSKYEQTYPKLLADYENWKISRKELVAKSKSNAETLDFNCKCASVCRLLGSSIDLFGSVGERILKHIGSDWATYALLTALCFGSLSLVSTVTEVLISQSVHEDMQECIKEDQQKFKKIENYFKQTKELDDAVKELFPYGIDKDIVRKIEEATRIHDDYLKIFTAALITNVEKKPELFKDRSFLTKVLLFSKSKVGKQWLKKIRVMEPPILLEAAKAFLENAGSQNIIISQSNAALPLEMTRFIHLQLQAKIVLNGLTMFVAYRSLKKGAKSKYSDPLRDLGTKTESEFIAIEQIVQQLRPSKKENEGDQSRTSTS